ncbi:hypothetical protein D3C71_2010640 [compost metagenome]
MFGLDQHYTGKVVDARVDEYNRNLALTIQPDTALPASAYQKAVAVDLYLGLPFGSAN